MRIPGLQDTSVKDLVKRSAKDFSDDDMLTYSAALSYSALFAIFPFIIFLVALLGFLNIPQFFDWLLEQAQNAFPADAYQRLNDVITQVRDNPNGGLLSFGIVAALWAASSGVRSLMNALNVAFDVEETRPMWKRYPLSVLYTLVLATLLAAAAGLMIVGPQAVEWLAGQAGLSGVFVTVWTWLRFPVLAILLTMVCALIYYALPNVEEPFAFITPGAVAAVVIWIIASIGFSIYVSNFADYSATYGSLGGVIVLMFYLYISSAVLLLGAEINAEIHHIKLGEPQPKEDA